MDNSLIDRRGDGSGVPVRPTRRGVLQVGVAASLLPAAAAAGDPPVQAHGLVEASLYKVIYDRDHPAAVDFGREARAGGLRTFAIGRDVTALWYDDLYHRWREGPAAIAGLTSVSVAMCLELMAWDAGLRTAYRSDHQPSATGGVRHVLSGPAAILDRATLLDTGAAWGTGAARMLSRCPAAGQARSTLVLDCAPTPGVTHAEALVSWVFAPVDRA